MYVYKYLISVLHLSGNNKSDSANDSFDRRGVSHAPDHRSSKKTLIYANRKEEGFQGR